MFWDTVVGNKFKISTLLYVMVVLDASVYEWAKTFKGSILASILAFYKLQTFILILLQDCWL